MTKVTQQERDIVEDGRHVQTLYDAYIGPYIENSTANLHRAFAGLKPHQTDEMVEINVSLTAIRKLDADLRTYIAKGRAIERKIDEREEH